MKLVGSGISYDVGMIMEFTQSQSILALHVRNVKDSIVSQGLNYLISPGSFSCGLLFIDAVRQNATVLAFYAKSSYSHCYVVFTISTID